MDNGVLWLLVIGSIAATFFWRFLGALFARRINPDGPIFKWVTCVSYAMLAALIARMVFMPIGPLEEVAGWIRVVGIISGLVAFFVFRRQLLSGVSVGLIVFVALVSYA